MKWRFLWHCHYPCHEAQLPTQLTHYLYSIIHFCEFFFVKLCKEIGHIDKTVPFHCALNKLSSISEWAKSFTWKKSDMTQDLPYVLLASVPCLMPAWAWWLNITQWSRWPVLSSGARQWPALSSADPMFTISQSLTRVSSHPLRPEAHYAGPGPSFPPVLCRALYTVPCTMSVMFVMVWDRERAASGRPQ